MLFHSSKRIHLFNSTKNVIETDTTTYPHFTVEQTEMPRSEVTHSRYKTSKWHSQDLNSNQSGATALTIPCVVCGPKHSYHLGAS